VSWSFLGCVLKGMATGYLAEAVLQVRGLQILKVDNLLLDGYSSEFWTILFSDISHLTELRLLGGASVRDVDLNALATLTKLTDLVAYRAPQNADSHCTSILLPNVSRMSHLKSLWLMGWSIHVTQLQQMVGTNKELQDLAVLPCRGGLTDWNTLLNAHPSLTKLDMRSDTFGCPPDVRLDGFGRLQDLTISIRGAERKDVAHFLPCLSQLRHLRVESDDNLHRMFSTGEYQVPSNPMLHQEVLHERGKCYIYTLPNLYGLQLTL
jgi:hypothetical protein